MHTLLILVSYALRINNIFIKLVRSLINIKILLTLRYCDEDKIQLIIL